MKKSKTKRRILLCCAAVLVFAAYLTRVYYVTSQAKAKMTTENYHIGEEVALEGYTISLDDVKTYSTEGFFEAYPALREYYDDYISAVEPSIHKKCMMVCTMTAVCEDVGADLYEFTSNFVQSGIWETQPDLFWSQCLSERELFLDEEDCESGRAVTVQLVYCVHSSNMSEMDEEHFNDLEWQMLVSNYPVRREIYIGSIGEHLTKSEK